MVNEDDGREDLFCTAGNISAFATAYSHGRYRLLNLKKNNKTKQNKKKAKTKTKKQKRALIFGYCQRSKQFRKNLLNNT